MRFFGAPTVLLALGVSAVAGHSYHAFEHGYEPAAGYAALQKSEIPVHDSHAAVPYDDFSDVPEFYSGLEQFPPNHGFNSYLEPLGVEKFEDNSHHQLHGHNHHQEQLHGHNHQQELLHAHSHQQELQGHSHQELQGYSHQEIHDFGHHNHQEHHQNYVVHDNHGKDEHHVTHEQQVNQEQKEHKEEQELPHGNYVSFELHSGSDSHEEEHEEKKHDEKKHDKKNHDEKKDDEGHDEHKSEANYQFKYGVNDPKTGDVKEQWESRTGDKVKGGYSLKESDGTTRVVHYSADKKKGFQATVHKIGNPKEKHSEHGDQSENNSF